MKVKELINKLLGCKMDADAVVLVDLVEIDKDTIKHSLEVRVGHYYPIADDVEIKEEEDAGTFVRIELEEFKK